MASYRNPWFRVGASGCDPEIYTPDAKPFAHAGCLIYQRIKGVVWDIVSNGVCVGQYAGFRGACEAAERYMATGSTRAQ
jgi:hypothetical protein